MVWAVALLLQQPVADLRALADRVVVADVVGQRPVWTAGGWIETEVELDVVRTERGARGPAALRLPGGRIGEVEVRESDVPSLRRGRYRFYLVGDRLLGGLGGAERLDAGAPGDALRAAFALNGASWAHQETPVEERFRLNPTSFPFAPDAVRRLFRAGLWVWTSEGLADVRLLEGPDTTTTRFGEADDDRNTLMFHARDEGIALGLARFRSVSGEMNDCDIRIYGENANGPIVWSLAAAGAPPGHYDLQQTVTHELGHCLGLSHSAVADAMMSRTLADGTGDERRHLHPDDVEGLQTLYGARVPPPPDAAVPDMAVPDAAPPDARPPDAGPPDAAGPDVPVSDAAAPDSTPMPDAVAADGAVGVPDGGDAGGCGTSLAPGFPLLVLLALRRRP